MPGSSHPKMADSLDSDAFDASSLIGRYTCTRTITLDKQRRVGCVCHSPGGVRSGMTAAAIACGASRNGWRRGAVHDSRIMNLSRATHPHAIFLRVERYGRASGLSKLRRTASRNAANRSTAFSGGWGGKLFRGGGLVGRQKL